MSTILDIILAPMKIAYDKAIEFYTKQELDNPERILENNDSTYKKMCSLMNTPIHIIDNIYLGTAVNAASYYKLKELDIGLIINITGEIRNYYENEFEHIQYPIADNGKEKITEHLIDSYKKITEYNEKQSNNILVHCFMGASRSVSVITFYIMKKYGKSFDEAFNMMLDKKKTINPSKRFREDIYEAINL